MKIKFGGLCLLAFCCQAFADQSKAPDVFDVKALDSYFEAQVKEKGRVGLAVGIVQDGKVVLAKGYGKRSLESNQAVEPETMFAIGSVSKQFTCAAVLLLAQDGKLSPNDKVAKYYPKLTRAGDITLLDLMNHTSGYPDYYPLDFVDRRLQKPIAPDELIQQYAGGKLDFEPATEWSYSNTGFIILGRVVEKITGKPLGDFLRERIFNPLGMTHTVYEPAPSDSRLATGYTSFALSQSEPVLPEASGWLGGAGGIYSSVGDLAKWDLALVEGKVMKSELYTLMTTSRELKTGKTTGYGCGLAIATVEHRTVLRHGGAVSGFNAYNTIVPSTRSAIVLLCNKDGGLRSLPETLTTLLLKEESNIPKIAGAPALEVVKKVFAQFQSGSVDRKQFGDEFNVFLSEAKLASASKRLKALGNPRSTELLRTSERGGMEVTTTRLKFASMEVDVLMYRMPNGTIEQFFIDER